MPNGFNLITENYKGKPTNIAFEVFLDSAPYDWIERCKDTFLPFAISPLHDKDINDDGTLKKPHYHCILCWPGPTTSKRVLSFIRDELHQPYPQDLLSVVGYYEYFYHKNNPEKYQYDPDLIQTYNGFDPSKYDRMSESEKDRMSIRIERFIDIYRITEYRQACYLLRECNKHAEYNFLRHNSLHFKTYISSLRAFWSGCDSEKINYKEKENEKLVNDILEDDLFSQGL